VEEGPVEETMVASRQPPAREERSQEPACKTGPWSTRHLLAARNSIVYRNANAEAPVE
jgi:hypothetical protein